MCRRPGVAVVAAADIGVGIADFAQHLPDQVIKILARAGERQELAVAVVHEFPVLPVHERRVEQVAFEAPRIFKHFRPFQRRVYLLTQMTEFQLLLGLGVLGRVCLRGEHGVIFVVPDQHAPPVERQGIAVHVLRDQRRFARLQVEEAQRGLLAAERSLDEPQRLRQVEDALAPHVKLADVGRIDGQRHGARDEAVEIDPDRLDRTYRLGRRPIVGLFIVIVRVGFFGLLVLRVICSRRRTLGAAACFVRLWRDR